MANNTLTNKVLELVARDIGEYFTGGQIVQLLEDFGYEREQINYPNTKWVTVIDALKLLRDTSEEPDIDVAQLIDTFLNPLNHEPNADNAHKLAEGVKRYLAYNKFDVEFDGTEYFVTAPSEQTNWNDVDNFLDTKKEEERKEKLPRKKDLLYQIRDYHQTYIDVLEIFCENTKKPQAKHNQAYITLRKKIPILIEELKLKHNKIDFYEPFAGDLYSAELEWNGTGDTLDIRLGPLLSWDAIRPRLHKTHSEIVTLITAVEKEVGLSDDEIVLESITELVAEHRAKKAKAPKKEDKVQKVHITYKQDDKKVLGFYIEKKDDDFYYKGDYLPLSKNSDYYKVFCALYDKLPEGGTIKYKDLYDEVRSRIKKVKTKSDTDLKTFILNKLTNTQNGFLRQAKIPVTQDNGKPLIATERGHGIVFNNKKG